MNTPVLFLIFNRPDLTKQVFARIREVRPAQLFIAADGPRADRPGEGDLCRQTRAIVDEVDWPCEVHTLFREQNIGCKLAVSGAITWFFEQVEEGIIIEDDCLPHPTFFQFCVDLLEKYRYDERVMVISGDNFQGSKWQCNYSYYFSIFSHIWGWASWRRAWCHYDRDLNAWSHLRKTPWLEEIFSDKAAVQYWKTIFDRASKGQIDTWDFAWIFSAWVQNGLTILPAVNLVSNIGFDQRATHTIDPYDKQANMPALVMKFPLNHPTIVARDFDADFYTLNSVLKVKPVTRFQVSIPSRVIQYAKRALQQTLNM